MTLCSKCQIDGEDFVNFCGLLRKHELYQYHKSLSSLDLRMFRQACCGCASARKIRCCSVGISSKERAFTETGACNALLSYTIKIYLRTYFEVSNTFYIQNHFYKTTVKTTVFPHIRPAGIIFFPGL